MEQAPLEEEAKVAALEQEEEEIREIVQVPDLQGIVYALPVEKK